MFVGRACAAGGRRRGPGQDADHGRADRADKHQEGAVRVEQERRGPRRGHRHREGEIRGGQNRLARRRHAMTGRGGPRPFIACLPVFTRAVRARRETATKSGQKTVRCFSAAPFRFSRTLLVVITQYPYTHI